MKNKNCFLISGISGFLFLLLIVLVRFADVAAVGPEGTVIGLSGINKAVADFTGVNMLWYDITDLLGIAAVVTAFLFGAAGLIQTIKRKSLFKVDSEILCLGGLYAIVIGLYILFETVIINYRPVIMPGCTQPEASFPSSHTMLVCTVMGSAAAVIGKYVKKKAAANALKTVFIAIIFITVLGRLYSGVHWFTDISGGVLISIALLSLFKGTCIRIKEKAKDNRSDLSD